MLRLPTRLFAVLAACACCTILHAQAVYKCQSEGKTAYSDRPCAHGASSAMPPPAGISLSDTLGPQGGDARTLLELEKARIAREKSQEKEGRVQVREARLIQAQRKKCDRLRLRRKWAEEDLARTAHGPKHEAARLKLRRQAEALAVECPA
ncbi:hypothetical protein AB595_15885 [Massilia sp. WF1]|uniref:DUF4124 domain-containing protein n=1 Tax=unclassified Massilia TaxID=2609279 RepID=UPI00064A3DA9|nr:MULTISPECIES: DUF4124 domain-containing protein [unclassified Massilia]ALK97152.1 hypothetical protein AM586_13735 [Massilia sp. WG5]KLU35882.1 hypothetical protein AB595_15885 [Massilia sp. WF1]